VRPDEIHFGELGYAREARASYMDFLAARARGELPAHLRFQVCLPTPLAVCSSFSMPADLPMIEPAYEQAMLRELDTICRTIPQADLCLQWDVCNELIIWDGQAPRTVTPSDVTRETMLERLARLMAAVPQAAELGIHLCYGDYGGRHMVEPKDAAMMVELGNALAAAARRRLDYIHMPVPIARTDEDFYRPLRALKLARDTELYLGVVHPDGAEGTKRRIAVAQNHVDAFGIATECGMARARTPDFVRKLIAVHAAVAREPVA
jgi:hypothetical protein